MGFGFMDVTEEMEKEWETQRQINNMKQAISDSNSDSERDVSNKLIEINKKLDLIIRFLDRIKEKI